MLAHVGIANCHSIRLIPENAMSVEGVIGKTLNSRPTGETPDKVSHLTAWVNGYTLE